MNLDLLKEVLAVPSHYSDTSALTRFLYLYAAGQGWRARTDKQGNVFMDKGTWGTKPLVCAHIDTVHPVQPLNIQEHGGMLYAVDKSGKHTGCGGDDKAGVAVCLHLMHTTDNLKAAFFTGEEIGAIGAREADARHFDNVGWAMEFDAPGTGIFSYTSGGVQLFKEDGKAIQKVEGLLNARGFRQWQHHPRTDIWMLKQRFGFTCFNLPCGYYNFHTDNEFVCIAEVNLAAQMGEEMLAALGCHDYPFKAPKRTPLAKSHTITQYTGSTPPVLLPA